MTRLLLSALAAAAVLPCAARAADGVPAGSARVTFLDVARASEVAPAGAPSDDYLRRLERRWGREGIGDAAVVETATRCILIDSGLWTKGRSVILPFLERRGVKRLDSVILTHQHGDHYGGLAEVLAGIPVGEVVTNGLVHTAKAYAKFLEEGRASGARYRVVRGGETLDWGGGVTAQVVHSAGAPGVEPDDYNNNSVVLRMACGKVHFLFAGDMEDDEEAALLASHRPLRSAVLKVGHHGSSSSSSFPFLKAVRPEVAVISVGGGNRFSLPHRSVTDRLEALGCAVYRTDHDGVVTVTTDGTGLTVETERPHVRPLSTRKPLREEFYLRESEAESLFRRKRYGEAAAAYRGAIAVEPGVAAAHSKLGYCLKRMGRRDEAVKAFEDALAREPCDPFANLHLGLSFMKTDKERALGHLEKYLDCHPGAGWSRLAEEKAGFIRGGLALDLKRAGREEEAIAEFERAVGVCGRCAFPHFQLGLLYAKRDPARARREFEEYLALEPSGRYVTAARDALAGLERKP